MWHGTQEKYQIFDTLGGRFNSEFGMEAFPHMETIKAFSRDPKDHYPQSQVMDFHNKADGHERRIATYLVENFRFSQGGSLEVRYSTYDVLVIVLTQVPLGTHLPNSSCTGGDNDVWLSGLAAPVGR